MAGRAIEAMKATRIDRAEEYFTNHLNESRSFTAQDLAYFAGCEVDKALQDINRILTEHLNVVDGVQTVIRKHLDGV